MLTVSAVATATGLVAVGWGLRPWGHTRAAWRGMTADEAMRWDGHRPTGRQRTATRAGAALTAAGLLGIAAALVVGG